MARHSSILRRVERLEDRTTPTQFGTPWADGSRVTLSFVPDGTVVDGAPSVLFQAMQSAGLGPATWQTEVVRAFHAWSTSTNLNVGLVADGGQPIGAAGAVQGDARFGDVRVSARPLSDNVLAITTPSGHLGGTRVGDIVLNSTKRFSVGGAPGTYDLYTVLLQEAGHALGVGNSADPASPMYETYGGVRVGLTAGDVGAVRVLYGATRAPDALEGSVGNNSVDRAAEVKYADSRDEQALRSLVVRADVTTGTDGDFYKFKTPKVNNGHGVTVRLTTGGFSALAPRLFLYNRNKAVVGQVQTTDPLKGELSLHLAAGSFALDTEYYLKVDSGAAGNKYQVGSYQLKLVFDPNAGDVVTAGSLPLQDDNHSNDEVARGSDLDTTPGYVEHSHYKAFAVLRDLTDLDFYKFSSAKIGSNQRQAMTVTVRAADPVAGLAPRASLYDKDKNPVAGAVVLVNADGTYTLQLPEARSDSDYYVGVWAANAGGARTGNYYLDIDFRSQVVSLDQLAAGTLTEAARTQHRTLEVSRNQAMHFLLSAAGGVAGDSAVRMTVHDAAGNVVFALVAKAGETVSATTGLAAGTYTVRLQGFTRSAGAALPNLTFDLKGATVSDPIAPLPVDPSATVANDYTWSQLEAAYYASLALADPFGDVVW